MKRSKFGGSGKTAEFSLGNEFVKVGQKRKSMGDVDMNMETEQRQRSVWQAW